MDGGTEIYICKNWQSLEEAEIEYSDQIENRKQAEEDAEEMCGLEPRIRKIAYYAVSDKGAYRRIFTFENPAFIPEPGNRKPKATPPRITEARLMSKRQDASMWSRFMGIFMEQDRPQRIGDNRRRMG